MVVSIIQSNYIPWKGYFDLIAKSDVFVIYDHVQYTKNDWRNRNIIKTASGLNWLTIPVLFSNSKQRIDDTFISWEKWSVKHWKTLETNYSKAPYFKFIAEEISPLYLENKYKNLSMINESFLRKVAGLLGINTDFRRSNEFALGKGKTMDLVEICSVLGADVYLTGPSARGYLVLEEFYSRNIRVEFMEYSNYKPYHQQFGEFVHEVSILDLLFNEGPQSRQFLKY